MIFAILLVIDIGGVQVGSSNVTQGASLTEWAVPTARSGPWGLALDQSGSCCWFVEYYGNNIAHFDSRTGSFQEWEIPTPNSNPYSIAVTSVAGNAMIWGTEFASDRVFAFFPATGKFIEYSLSGAAGVGYVSVEPHPGNVRVWFTETTKNSNGEFVYDPASENVTFYEDTFPSSVGGGAYDVQAGMGYVWFAGFSALVRWDRTSAQYTIWPLPHHDSAVTRSITFDSQGQLWYTQGVEDAASNDNFVGVLRGNMIQEWRIPRTGSNPRGIGVNPLTRQPWVAEQSLQGNGTVSNLSNFVNGTLSLSSPITVVSGGTATVLSPTTSHASELVHTVTPTTRSIVPSNEGPFDGYVLGSTLPSDVVVDSSGNVWISEPGANKIARLVVSSDYALSTSSIYLSSAQGTSVPITVTGTSVSGYAGDVTFTATGMPPGVTLSGFDPNPVHIPSGGNASSNFAINIAPTAAPGTYFVVIQGNDGAISHTVGPIIAITNSTSPASSAQSKAQCSIPIPTYLSDLTLLSSLLADVLIGGLYIGLPVDAVGRRFHLLRGLSRKTWLAISLFGPSVVLVGSILSLSLC